MISDSTQYLHEFTNPILRYVLNEELSVERGRTTITPLTTSWHMQPTIAATDELSAPPESGNRKPDALLRRK